MLWVFGTIFCGKDAFLLKKWLANQPQPTKIYTKSAYLKLLDVFKVQKRSRTGYLLMENLPFVDEIYGPIDKRRISISIAMLDHERGPTKVSTISSWWFQPI